ncbi:MAG TPA: LacI family DNA-binding transcriptional regulator [Micromonosporaceae bacterium]
MSQDLSQERGSSQVTLDDVAGFAGVSRQTVSNVINAPERVREQTRQRVEQAIIQLGYQPNRAARALRAQASRMIGYRIEPVHEQSLASIHDRFLHALADAGREADHYLLLFTADDPDAELAACTQLFRTGGVDGFVLYGIDHGDHRPAALRGLGAPFAAFGRTDHDTEHCWVDVDNLAGVSDAVDHLVERGHRRIGFAGWPEGSGVGDRRAEGWRTALARHGLLAECHGLDVRGTDSIEEGARLGRRLLDLDKPPSAVVAATDTLAVGVMQAARVHGLSVGRDLALVGFDDTPSAHVLGLSSVRQPIEAVGRTIVEMLLERLPGTLRQTDTPPGPVGRLLAPTLVVRDSSGATVPHVP